MGHAMDNQIDPQFEEVLSDAKRGADHAWAILYAELAGPIRGYLASRGVADPDDLASETFLQVARDIHNFEGDSSSFRSWVFVIAHRRMIDARRSQQRRPTTTPLPDVAEDLIKGGDTEEEAMGVLSQGRFEELLDGLTDSQKQVVSLRIVADLTLEETARVLGKNVGSVKALQNRAMTSIRSNLQESRVTI